MAFLKALKSKPPDSGFFAKGTRFTWGFQENVPFFQKKSACQLQHLTFVIVFYPHAFLFLVPDR
ncbi:hypothetical protein JRG66_07680 [Salinimicrobium tongyeongense]|uniref:Uncharacterized protein n=1 Tax=Salinimicrobium tongyeongense TaxID=2809707 RepID=A0ABY6NUX7_9FLAO|nr:hypothetical protein [Salinimicrobium tongyeongense]UZH56722.1 hypothetical protein JRG66_07680 [Salinimicrobium tongyeongense]